MPRLHYEVAIQLGWFKNPILIAWYTSGFDNIRNLYFVSRKSSHIKQKRYFFSENIWKLQIIITDIFPSWDLNPILRQFLLQLRPKEWPMTIKRIWHLVYCAKLKINSHLCVQSLLPSFEYWAPTVFPALGTARDRAVNKVSSFSSTFMELPFYIRGGTDTNF